MLRLLKISRLMDFYGSMFFLYDAKKLRMVIFYNKQLKNPMPRGNIRDKTLNFHGVDVGSRIRNTKHRKSLLDMLVKMISG